MKRLYCSPSTCSTFCWSSAVPRVHVTSAWVSPRVKTTEPCVRGRTPTSAQIGRISSNFRPSRRTPCSRTSSRSTFSLSSLKICFAHFSGARLHHDDAVVAAGHDEIDAALLPLLERGVDHVRAIDQADAHAGNRLGEGDFGDGERRRRAGDRQHVRVVLRIGGQNERDDLSLVSPASGEERANGTVDEPAGQDFFFRRFALALEEAAGNPARRVRVFAIVDRQRQEINSLPRARLGAGGDEHRRIAHPDDNGAISLLGKFAGFQRDRVRAHLELALVQIHVMHRMSLKVWEWRTGTGDGEGPGTRATWRA